MLLYKVTKKYSKGPEQLVAKFDKQDDAKNFIQIKLEEDITLRVQAAYCLYEMDELMEIIDQGTAGGGSQQGGQQKSSTVAFRPSPLQTSPRPTVMPATSFKEVDEDDK